MNTLLIATANSHKLDEFKKILPKDINILSLKDFPEISDIAETGESFSENAWIKASTLFNHTGIITIADDSGLVTSALDGAPGIYSARYACEPSNDAANRKKLLNEMANKSDRNASFVCAIALVGREINSVFEGQLKGEIVQHERGHNGFGYDSIFVPIGYTVTLAEMEAHQKNKISHRYLAIQKLFSFLSQNFTKQKNL